MWSKAQTLWPKTNFLTKRIALSSTYPPSSTKYLLISIYIYTFFSDELVHEKERYKTISEELDSTFQELSGY